MKKFRLTIGVVAAVLSIVVADTAMAQTPDSAASTLASKGERRAQRKGARAKKNVELKKLESAGYKPSEDQTNYPDNVQNAAKKAP